MKNLFALAFVACSIILVSCGEKTTTPAKDSVVVVAPSEDTSAVKDTTPVVAPDTNTTKKEEVKK